MEKYLRALHPFMPFLTEKIWQNIPHDGESIMVSGYPLNDSRNLDVIDDLSESLIGSLSEIIGEIRKVRTEQKINPSLKIRVNIDSANPEMLESLKENIEIVKSLAGIDVIEFYAPPDSSGFIKIAKNGVTIYICLQGLFDAVAGQERVLFEMEKINLEIDKSRKKLSNPQFRDKAPEQIIKKESLKLEKLQKEMDSLKEQLKLFRQLKI
jgi:valyl-tRNA synthetase